jgi:hypothetical protein
MFVLAHRRLMNWGKEEAWNAIIREAEGNQAKIYVFKGIQS